MRYGLYLIIFVFDLIILRFIPNDNLDKIVNWLIGINFTLSIFAINFTFFSYQLSKYKPLVEKLSVLQWLNIVSLLVFPFFPVVLFLINPNWGAIAALLIMPAVIFSAIDNCIVMNTRLDPSDYIRRNFSNRRILNYFKTLMPLIKKEVEKHTAYVERNIEQGKGTKIPMAQMMSTPDTVGHVDDDLWDKIIVLTKLAIQNNDTPNFMRSLDAVINILSSAYDFKLSGQDSQVPHSFKSVVGKKLQFLFKSIFELDKERIFSEIMAKKFSDFLVEGRAAGIPLDALSSSCASNLKWFGEKLLLEGREEEATKILITFHSVVTSSIEKCFKEQDKGKYAMEEHNIPGYVHFMKSLGQAAVKARGEHFVYRCGELLSYLGCEAVKKKNDMSVLACMEALVQLGRESRHAGFNCFWDNCFVPIHGHMETFLKHIFTWLIIDVNKEGEFRLKRQAEDAFSRLRGGEFKLEAQPEESGKILLKIVEVLDSKNKPVPYVIVLSDSNGEKGEMDYSNFSNLKEYSLR